jgi:hypothetical protein
MKNVFMLLLVTATSYTQTNPPRQIFKSPDGMFRFRYPKSLVLCQPHFEEPPPHLDLPDDVQEEKHTLTGWTPDSCGAYLSICPRDALVVNASGRWYIEPIACIAYPSSAYEGTNFGGAAFSVSVLPYLTTEHSCLADQAGAQKIHWGRVAGVKAKVSENGEGGLSHGLGSDVYQLFRSGQCYDIEIRLTQTSPSVYDPGRIKVMSNHEEERIHQKLKRILNSFQFLK